VRIILKKKLCYAFARKDLSVDKFSQKFTPTRFGYRVSQNKVIRLSVVDERISVLTIEFNGFEVH